MRCSRASAFTKAATAELKACQANPIDRAKVEELRGNRAEIGLAIGLLDGSSGGVTPLISDSAAVALGGQPKLQGKTLMGALQATAQPAPPTP